VGGSRGSRPKTAGPVIAVIKVPWGGRRKKVGGGGQE